MFLALVDQTIINGFLSMLDRLLLQFNFWLKFYHDVGVQLLFGDENLGCLAFFKVKCAHLAEKPEAMVLCLYYTVLAILLTTWLENRVQPLAAPRIP